MRGSEELDSCNIKINLENFYFNGAFMLIVHRSFGGMKSVDARAGDVNEFMKSILVEVASENYRQTMYELISLVPDKYQGDRYLDPPLRANERVMSGLFATAISRVASRSRTEVRVDRELDVSSEIMEGAESDQDDGDNSVVSVGRVDYLAWYNKRTVAVELKMAGFNCQDPLATENIVKKWEKVVKQAQTAQSSLKDLNSRDRVRYPEPISLSVMVLLGRRRINGKLSMGDDGLEEMKNSALNMIYGLKKKPSFVASYVFPREFRQVAIREKGYAKENSLGVYVPFVFFIGKEFVYKK